MATNLTKTLTLKIDGVDKAINSVEELNQELLKVDKNSTIDVDIDSAAALSDIKKIQKSFDTFAKSANADISAVNTKLKNIPNVDIDVDVNADKANKQLKDLKDNASDAKLEVGDVTGALSSIGGGQVSGAIDGAAGGIGQIRGLLTKIPPQAAAVVAALALLAAPIVAFFSRTKEGQNDLKLFFGTIKGGFDGLLNGLAIVGKAFLDTFSSIGTLIKDVVTGNFDNLDASLAKVKTSIQGVGTAFKQAGEEITKGAAAGKRIAELEIAFTKLEIAITKSNAALTGQLELIDSLLGSEQNTLEESINLINKRAELQKKLLGNEIQLQAARLAIVNESLKLNATDDALLKERAQLEGNLAAARSKFAAIDQNTQNEKIAKIKEARDIEIDGARATLDAKKDSIEKAAILNKISTDDAIAKIQDLNAQDEAFYDEAIKRLKSDVEGRKASQEDLKKAEELEEQRKLKALEKRELIAELILRDLDKQVTATDNLVKSIEREQKAIDELGDTAVDSYEDVTEGIIKSTEALNVFSDVRGELTIAEQKANVERQKALNAVKQQELESIKIAERIFNTRIEALDAELEKLDEQRRTQGFLTEAEQQRYNDTIQKIKEASDANTDAQKEAGKTAKDQTDSINDTFDKLKESNKKTAEQIKADRIALANDIANAAVEIFDSINQILDQQNEEAISRLEKRAESASELIDELNAKTEESTAKQEELSDQLATSSEKDRARIIKQLEREANREARLQKQKVKQEAELKKIEDEKRKAQKEQFERTKAASIIQAIINTALGIGRVIADVPKVDFGVTSAILVGITAAVGAAQVAAIASQPTPQFAEGGFTGPGTLPDSTGHKVAGVVHDGEWVAPKWMVNSPKFSPVIQEMEQSRYRGYASGGFVSSPTVDNSGVMNQLAQTNANILKIAQTPIVVDVRQVTSEQQRVAQVVSNAKL